MVLGPIVVLLMSLMFQIPVWAAAIAVPLAVIMGFIAARVTGETDVTPTKALGPVTQILYRFGARDTVLAIDGRDAPAISAIPNLVRLPHGQPT